MGILSPFKAAGRGLNGILNRGTQNAIGAVGGDLNQVNPQDRASLRSNFLMSLGRGLQTGDIGGNMQQFQQGQAAPLLDFRAKQAAEAKALQEQEALKQQQAAFQQQMQAAAAQGPEALRSFALANNNPALANAAGQAIPEAPGREVVGTPIEMKIGNTDVLANRFKDGSIEVIQGAQRPTKLEPFLDANGDKVLLDVNNLPSGTKIEQGADGPTITNDAGVFRLKGSKAIPVTTPDGVQVAPEQQKQIVPVDGTPYIANLKDGTLSSFTNAQTGEVVKALPKPKNEVDSFGRAVTLRDKYVRDIGQIPETVLNISKLRGIVKSGTPISDIAATSIFNRILEPDSVTREAEAKLTREARSAWDSLKIYVGKLTEGNTLTPKQVDDMLKQAELATSGIKEYYKQQRTFYTDMSDGYGVPSWQVVGPELDFGQPLSNTPKRLKFNPKTGGFE